MTAALLLALACSISYGAADFLGGVAARDAHVLLVVVIAAPVSLLVELLLWPLVGASFPTAAVTWGAASGLASAAGFALLYRTLAIGPMSVLSPVTALVSAALPVTVGLLDGETLSGLAVGGMTLAFIAIVVVSGGTDTRGVRPSRTALALAFGAGAAIALQLVCLDQAPNDSGIAPLIIGRAVSSALVLFAAFALRRASVNPAEHGGLLGCRCARLAGEFRVPARRPRRRPCHRRGHHRALPGRHRPAGAHVPWRAHRATQLAGLGLAAVAVTLLAVG